MFDCQLASYNRCIICEFLTGCANGKLAVKRATTADRSPDALTNDYIYCRGEFDSFVNISKVDVIKYSELFREKVRRLRQELGLG